MTLALRAALTDVEENIRSRPGRTSLAFLALAVGMAALTAVASLLGGLESRARGIVEELGADVFAVLPEKSGDVPPAAALRTTHAAVLRQNLPGAKVCSVRLFEDVPAGGERRVRVVAAEASLLEVRPWRMVDGRFLDEQDVAMRDRVAVAGETVAAEWGIRVGDSISLGDGVFRVAGIVRIESGALEAEGSHSSLLAGGRMFFVPLSVDPEWFGRSAAAGEALSVIFARAPPGERAEWAAGLVRELLAQPDLGAPSISIVTADSLIARIRSLQSAIRYTAGSVALLCIALGGATLMSLLVANVRERVPEIGLRRALGATAFDVASLFVLEALLLTVAAAVAGALAAIGLLGALRSHIPAPIRLDPALAAAPLAFGLLAGAIFSYWPARLAARIAPAEALRNE